jgi:hypothetical protein
VRYGFKLALDHEVRLSPSIVTAKDFHEFRVDNHVAFRVARLGAVELRCLNSDQVLVPTECRPLQRVDLVAAKSGHRCKQQDLELFRAITCKLALRSLENLVLPNASIARSKRFVAVSGLPMSPSTSRKFSGSPIDAAASWSRASVRALPTTLSPRLRYASAIASPIPLEAPVTITVFDGTSDFFARGQRVVVGVEQESVQRVAPNAHVPAAEQRKHQRVLEQAVQRIEVVVAVDADDAHEVGDDADRRLGAEDLRVARELRRRGASGVDGPACAQGERAHRLDAGLRVDTRA